MAPVLTYVQSTPGIKFVSDMYEATASAGSLMMETSSEYQSIDLTFGRLSPSPTISTVSSTPELLPAHSPCPNIGQLPFFLSKLHRNITCPSATQHDNLSQIPTAPQTLLHTNPLSTSRHFSMLLASKNSQDMTATSSLEPFQSLHLPPSQPRTAEDILSVEETTTSISFSSPFTPTQILATSTLTYQHQLTTSKSRDSRSAPLPLPSQPLTLDATSDKGTWILLHSLQPSIPKTTISSSPIQKSYFLTDIGSVAYSSQDVLPSIPDITATSTEVFAVHYLSIPEIHFQTIDRNPNVLFYGTKSPYLTEALFPSLQPSDTHLSGEIPSPSPIISVTSSTPQPQPPPLLCPNIGQLPFFLSKLYRLLTCPSMKADVTSSASATPILLDEVTLSNILSTMAPVLTYVQSTPGIKFVSDMYEATASAGSLMMETSSEYQSIDLTFGRLSPSPTISTVSSTPELLPAHSPCPNIGQLPFFLSKLSSKYYLSERDPT